MHILSSDNPLPAQFKRAEEVIRMVVTHERDELTCAALMGGAGLGKSHLVQRIVADTGVRSVIVRGTGPALLQAAYRERRGGNILLDDADSMVVGGGTRQANLLKSLLLPERKRLIVSETVEAVKNLHKRFPNPAIPPPRFFFYGSTTWLTNFKMADLFSSPKMHDHMMALFDRGLVPIELSDSREHALEWVLHLIANEELLGRKYQLSLAATQDVVDWLCHHLWSVRHMSVRLALTAGMYRQSRPDHWRDMMRDYLLPSPIGDGDNPVPRPPQIRPPVRAAVVVLESIETPAKKVEPAEPTSRSLVEVC